MNHQTKSAMERVRNPQGRADWLAAKLLREGVRRSNSRLLSMAFEQSRGELENLLKDVLGPRTKAGREVKRIVKTGREILGELSAH